MIRKFLVALAGAAALAVASALSDNHVDTVEWVQMVIAVATAVQVWLTANTPSLTWAKALAAIVLGVTNVLVGVIFDGLNAADWAALVLAAVTAAGVYSTPNTGTSTPAASDPLAG